MSARATSGWSVGPEHRTLHRDGNVVGMMDSPELAEFVVEAIDRCGRLELGIQTAANHNRDVALEQLRETLKELSAVRSERDALLQQIQPPAGI